MVILTIFLCVQAYRVNKYFYFIIRVVIKAVKLYKTDNRVRGLVNTYYLII